MAVLEPRELLVPLIAIALGYAVLRFMLWRAILTVSPTSLGIEADEPPGREKLPDELKGAAAELKQLGFTSIGSHLELPRLGPALTCFDFAREEERTFATLFLDRDGVPRAYFLSRIAPEGFVISANYRRAARNEPGRYLSGGLEDVATDRVYKAHARLLAGLPLQPAADQEARIAAAREWLSGPGRSEIRQQNLHGLLWTVGTLGMVAAAILRRQA
ncbi:MAG: hypothetical protein WBV82_06745 [Myxococcaceae bacterium]